MTQDIFNAYAQIALQSGLIQPQPLTKQAERKATPEELSTVEMLYGKVQPFDLLQQAHPEPCIISPSYDRVNGLVENLVERHNVMCGIATKPEQAKLIKQRYASTRDDLLTQLLKIGFMMDNQQEEELRVLADTCAEGLVKEALLPAIPAYVIAALWGTGILTGYQTLFSHLTFPQGVIQDADRALQTLQDAIKEEPKLEADVQDIIKHIQNIKDLATKSLDTNAKLVGSTDKFTPKTTLQFIKNNNDQQLISQLEQYRDQCIQLMEEIPSMVSILKERLKQYSTALNPKLDILRRVFRTVFPSYIQDAWNALDNLFQSLADQPSLAEKNIALIKSLKEKTQQVIDKAAEKHAQ